MDTQKRNIGRGQKVENLGMNEGKASMIDLRSDYDEVAYVSGGTLYRKGNTVQAWWDKWGKETWTCLNDEQAIENFKAMKDRWSSSEKPEPTGTCYEDAGRFLLKQPDSILIHGTIEAPSLGKRIGHAWIETDTGYIWEPRSGQYMTPKTFSVFEPVEEARYSAEEASILSLRTGHWGPWRK